MLAKVIKIMKFTNKNSFKRFQNADQSAINIYL